MKTVKSFIHKQNYALTFNSKLEASITKCVTEETASEAMTLNV